MKNKKSMLPWPVFNDVKKIEGKKLQMSLEEYINKNLDVPIKLIIINGNEEKVNVINKRKKRICFKKTKNHKRKCKYCHKIFDGFKNSNFCKQECRSNEYNKRRRKYKK